MLAMNRFNVPLIDEELFHPMDSYNTIGDMLFDNQNYNMYDEGYFPISDTKEEAVIYQNIEERETNYTT
jgi:hypothetical protein